VLCPSHHGDIEQVLPPLTSSSQVDAALYSIIAIAFRDFVHKWYTEITFDQEFVREILLVISHVTRGLEERLRRVDLDIFGLDDVPGVIWNHVYSFKQAKERLARNFDPELTFEEIFYHETPHPALASKHAEEVYLNTVVEVVLAILLPSEDLASHCERLFVREVGSSLVFGQTVDKLSEPFVFYEGIINILDIYVKRDKSAEVSNLSIFQKAKQFTANLQSLWTGAPSCKAQDSIHLYVISLVSILCTISNPSSYILQIIFPVVNGVMQMCGKSKITR
jgi:hypothetical protein